MIRCYGEKRLYNSCLEYGNRVWRERMGSGKDTVNGMEGVGGNCGLKKVRNCVE